MEPTTHIKTSLLAQINQLLDLKINTALDAIESAKEARDSDTKSSMGDKYETGRAMMHIEIAKNEALLIKTKQLKHELNKIQAIKTTNLVQFGSLVTCNTENYFISIATGKLMVNNEAYYAISLASPIGQVLQNKKIGDHIIFQNRDIIINDIS